MTNTSTMPNSTATQDTATPALMTRKVASKLLRNAIGYDEGNDWGGTESSSGAPLTFFSSGSTKTLERLYGDDEEELNNQLYNFHKSEVKRWQKKGFGEIPTDYKIPESFSVQRIELTDALMPKIKSGVRESLSTIAVLYPEEVKAVFGEDVELPQPPAELPEIDELVMCAQKITFAGELYEVFSQLGSPAVYIVDCPSDPYDSILIIGKCSDGVICGRSILVRT